MLKEKDLNGGGEAIETAEVVLPCSDLPETLTFFTEQLSFRLEQIFPADKPATAVISGHGLRIRLQQGTELDRSADPGHLVLQCRLGERVKRETRLVAPNGTRIELLDANPPLALPPVTQSLIVTRMDGKNGWGIGRAGMGYRDLIPDRQGGRFIASHIRIPEGGSVPDMVHFHKARFQMIYCYKGWVNLLYEDQGPQFTMRAGDCVLQPPEIRHRVLDCSPGFEVIEIGSPAEHMTCIDHDMALPTPDFKPERDFKGQCFLHHRLASASWRPGRLDGVQVRDIGIGDATGGLAGARVLRLVHGADSVTPQRHHAEFVFFFVLEGSLLLLVQGHKPQPLAAGDAFVIPENLVYAFEDCSRELELLEVSLPADYPFYRG